MFIYVYFVCFRFILRSCNIMSMVRWTWCDWSLILRSHLPSVLWHCWLGHLTGKNPSPIWSKMFGGTLNLAQSINRSIYLRISSVLVSCLSGPRELWNRSVTRSVSWLAGENASSKAFVSLGSIWFAPVSSYFYLLLGLCCFVLCLGCS